MDAILSYRPSKMELLTLIDRRFSRDLPIQPDYKGRQVDSIASQRVEVLWEEVDGRDAVLLTEPASWRIISESLVGHQTPHVRGYPTYSRHCQRIQRGT